MDLDRLVVYRNNTNDSCAGRIVDKINQDVKGQTTSITMYVINRELSYEDDGEGWFETENTFDIVNPRYVERYLTYKEENNTGILIKKE